MLYVYIGCLTFGAIYSILSLVLGAHGFDHGADHSGFHGDGGADHADMPSPFNPLVIASAITSFGAVGLIGKLGFKMGELMSAALAVTFAGIIGALIFFCVVRLMYSSQSDSTFSQNDLVGNYAEVITPIPKNGMGEIAYVINEVRYTMSARSAYSEEIARGESVRIKEIVSNAACVTRKISVDDLDLLDTEDEGNEIRNKNKNI